MFTLNPFQEWRNNLYLNGSFNQEYLSSMQENQLHCWRLKDKIDFAMSGYGSKIKSFSFTDNSKYLATSGAIDDICWPFDGDGPMGLLFMYLMDFSLG